MSKEKKYISTGSAPGTCCPDQKYVSGICSGCGLVKMSEAKEKYYKEKDFVTWFAGSNYIKELEEQKNICLYEDDFKSLISGKIISTDGVEIALADIGYFKMLEILMKEMG